jgi:hypothetical protein
MRQIIVRCLQTKMRPSLIIGLIASVSLSTAATTTTPVLAQTPFESEEDGFRLQVPQGWVIEDFDNISFEPFTEDIAMICLENEALPAIGGESNCQAANRTDFIGISRWPDLQSMPAFEDIPTPPTTNDLVALFIQSLQNGNRTSDIQIVNDTDIDEFTKIVNMTWTFYDDVGTPFNPFDDFTYNVKSLDMFVLSQDRNTGYIIFNNLAIPNVLNITEHSPAVQEVFNSFELIE